jgi:hypothetical protein
MLLRVHTSGANDRALRQRRLPRLRVDTEKGEPAPAFAEYVRDIEGLFDLIREAIERKAHKVDVSYDRVYGYPTSIDLDYLFNAVDDELQVTVSGFQPQR